jgi:hypothetical protein
LPARRAKNFPPDFAPARATSRQIERDELVISDPATLGAVGGGECYSACNFDPLSWGIGVQN